MKQVPVSKPERARIREPWQDHEQGVGAMVPWDHRRLFAQLFTGGDGEVGYASRSPALMASSERLMIEALAGQLVPRMQGGTQWPLLAVLYLPRLGRINTRVQKDPGAWTVELEAEDERTAQWLGRVQKRYEDLLAGALGQPVDVHLRHVGPT